MAVRDALNSGDLTNAFEPSEANLLAVERDEHHRVTGLVRREPSRGRGHRDGARRVVVGAVVDRPVLSSQVIVMRAHDNRLKPGLGAGQAPDDVRAFAVVLRRERLEEAGRACRLERRPLEGVSDPRARLQSAGRAGGPAFELRGRDLPQIRHQPIPIDVVCHVDAGGRRHGPAAEVGRHSHRQRADADEAEGQNQALAGQTHGCSLLKRGAGTRARPAGPDRDPRDLAGPAGPA